MTDRSDETEASADALRRSARDRFTSKPLAAARFVAQRALLKPLVWSLLRVDIVGRTKLEAVRGGFIVVANHSSHLDAPLIMCSLPRRLARYLAAAAAGDYFFEVWWRRALTALFFNAFPVDRSRTRPRQDSGSAPGSASAPDRAERAAASASRRKTVATRGSAPVRPGRPASRPEIAGGRPISAKSLLRRGIPVLVFPEGTRSRDGELGAFNPGAAAIAASCDVPLVPVALIGAHEAQPRGSSWPKSGRPPVAIVFGEPMQPALDEEPSMFIERIKSEIVRLRGGYRAVDPMHTAKPESSGPRRPASSEGASA